MKRVLLFVNDSIHALDYWKKESSALLAHNPDIEIIQCHCMDQACHTLMNIQKNAKNEQLIGIITDNSISATPLTNVARRINSNWSEGFSLVREVRSGTYGEENKNVPIAMVSKGALPSESSLSPPPVMLAKMDATILQKWLQGDSIPEAYNFNQLRDFHINTLIGLITPPGASDSDAHNPGWLEQLWAWMMRREPSQPDHEAARNQRDVYQHWLQSLPPAESDEFIKEKIDFTRYSFENALPYSRGARVWPERKQMQKLQKALDAFDRHSPYIPNDELNTRVLSVMSDIRSCVSTYFKGSPAAGWSR